MTADVELLPCPFCGSPAHLNTIRTSDKEFIRLNGRDTGYGVNCEQCGTTNRGFAYGRRTVEKAVEHWNTRANLAPLQAENERLRAEVAELRRTLWLTVQSAGGRLWIERREAEAFDPDRSEVTVEWCPENGCHLVRASTTQEDRNG